MNSNISILFFFAYVEENNILAEILASFILMKDNPFQLIHFFFLLFLAKKRLP